MNLLMYKPLLYNNFKKNILISNKYSIFSELLIENIYGLHIFNIPFIPHILSCKITKNNNILFLNKKNIFTKKKYNYYYKNFTRNSITKLKLLNCLLSNMHQIFIETTIKFRKILCLVSRFYSLGWPSPSDKTANKQKLLAQKINWQQQRMLTMCLNYADISKKKLYFDFFLKTFKKKKIRGLKKEDSLHFIKIKSRKLTELNNFIFLYKKIKLFNRYNFTGIRLPKTCEQLNLKIRTPTEIQFKKQQKKNDKKKKNF